MFWTDNSFQLINLASRHWFKGQSPNSVKEDLPWQWEKLAAIFSTAQSGSGGAWGCRKPLLGIVVGVGQAAHLIFHLLHSCFYHFICCRLFNWFINNSQLDLDYEWVNPCQRSIYLFDILEEWCNCWSLGYVWIEIKYPN